MLLIDAFFRFTGFGFLVLLTVTTLRDVKNSKSSLYLALASFSVMSLFVGLSPPELAIPGPIKMLFRFLDVPHLIFIWLFSLSLFQKDFKIQKTHVIAGFLYSGSIFVLRLTQYNIIAPLPIWYQILIDISALLIIIHLITFTFIGRKDDLLEKRRRSRIYFVLIISLVTFASVLVDFTYNNSWKIPAPTIDVLIIWPAIIWTSYWLFSISPKQYSFKDNDHLLSKNKLNLRNKTLKTKLDKEVLDNKAYLENGLTITDLAKRLGVSSHRLREFINQVLDHDNFSSYINIFRIKAIKKEFDNPDNINKPILTIALNNGFNSLSPFNRAFKAIESATPSEYRLKRIIN